MLRSTHLDDRYEKSYFLFTLNLWVVSQLHALPVHFKDLENSQE